MASAVVLVEDSGSAKIVHGYAGSGCDLLFQCQSIGVGFERIQLRGDGLPRFRIIAYDNPARVWAGGSQFLSAWLPVRRRMQIYP